MRRLWVEGLVMRSLLAAVSLLPLIAAADPPSPILTTPDAHDALSYAEPQVARVAHVDLDLAADFSTHTMAGTATLDILAAPGATRIMLDDSKLAIAAITDSAGHPLHWSVGASDPYKGAPLTVEIGAARKDRDPLSLEPRRGRAAMAHPGADRGQSETLSV